MDVSFQGSLPYMSLRCLLGRRFCVYNMLQSGRIALFEENLKAYQFVFDLRQGKGDAAPTRSRAYNCSQAHVNYVVIAMSAVAGYFKWIIFCFFK